MSAANEAPVRAMRVDGKVVDVVPAAPVEPLGRVGVDVHACCRIDEP